MTTSQSFRWSTTVRIVIAVAALLTVATASAQAVQNLTIGFQAAAGGAVTATAVPLSDWLTASIALLVAVSALVVMRRQRLRGRKLLSALLAVAASATMFGVTGERIISTASAVAPVVILDLTSPTVNVGALVPNAFVQVNVLNNTGQSAQITSITLDNGIYLVSTPTTCTVGVVLAPSTTCSIMLAAQS
jgi:hypothetical protein